MYISTYFIYPEGLNNTPIFSNEIILLSSKILCLPCIAKHASTSPNLWLWGPCIVLYIRNNWDPMSFFRAYIYIPYVWPIAHYLVPSMAQSILFPKAGAKLLGPYEEPCCLICSFKILYGFMN